MYYVNEMFFEKLSDKLAQAASNAIITPATHSTALRKKLLETEHSEI